MPVPIRKAIFPVGGLGTRFLPATKSMPKEMLPVVDKPLIQYAVEEAREAGIEEFIFVTGRGKTAIEDHFDHAYELQTMLESRHRDEALAMVKATIPGPGQIAYTRQLEPLGLGHAVWCARNFVGMEPVAVLLADDLILGKTGCLKEMIEAYNDVGGNMVAVMEVPDEDISSYGVIAPGDRSGPFDRSSRPSGKATGGGSPLEPGGRRSVYPSTQRVRGPRSLRARRRWRNPINRLACSPAWIRTFQWFPVRRPAVRLRQQGRLPGSQYCLRTRS